jgi:hypothetical protein
MRAHQRSYIKRKRVLNDSTEAITRTLRFINQREGFRETECDVVQGATALAHAVEAACFVSVNKSSEERYRLTVALKTAQLCQSLLARPKLDFLRARERARPPLSPPGGLAESDLWRDGGCLDDEYGADDWVVQ